MYFLTLTQEDIDSISFVGDRYCWSDWLNKKTTDLNEGEEETILKLQEHEAWEFNEEVHKDMEGNHSPFPMLDPGSMLYEKLVDLIYSIV